MAQVNVRNRKRADGSNNWEYRFEAARVNGKRKSISKSGFKTKKEALKEGIKALAEYNHAGNRFEPSEISVADMLDYWIKNYCEVNLSDNTTHGYAVIINNHLKPRIGSYKLKSIDTLTLQNCLNELSQEGKFKESYMKTFLKVVKGSFKFAQKTAKFIQSNPAEDIGLPKNIKKNDEDKMIILSQEDVQRILKRFENHPNQYYPILISYYTGLRVSEVYGLTWDCIDLENKTIMINKIMKHFDYNSRKEKKVRGIKSKIDSIWYLGEPKTKSSYRTILIGDTLCDALKTLKSAQELNKKNYGDYYIHTYVKDEYTRNNKPVQRIIQSTEPLALEEIELVCVKDSGESVGTSAMKYPSKVINEELHIDFNFHALRHTHATMMIQAGIPIKAVSERLGHSSTKITWDIYVSVTNEMEQDAVDMFEKMHGNLSTI